MSKPKGVYYCQSKGAYEKFCKANWRVDIPFDKWVEVMRTFNTLFMEYVMKTGEKVKIPRGFGSLAIAKYKKKRYRTYNGVQYPSLCIDWVKTKAVGKYVYHMNNHTDGYNFKWNWFRREARSVSLQEAWIFTPNRAHSRGLAAHINKIDRKDFDKYKNYTYKVYTRISKSDD